MKNRNMKMGEIVPQLRCGVQPSCMAKAENKEFMRPVKLRAVLTLSARTRSMIYIKIVNVEQSQNRED
jgi:hypothetical protein